MNKVNKNKGRGLASMMMLITFIMLIPSGIMMHLYDMPGDNGARHFAMGMHNICATVFVVSGLFHVKYNLRPIARYITSYRKEVLITAALTMVILLFSVLHAFHG